MTTGVPTCAPNLWGQPSWECPSCSCAMHAAYHWYVTLTGLSSPNGSFLVLRLNVPFTPHAWTPRDLGFSLLITSVWSGTHLTRPDVTSPSLCCEGHISTSWWSTSDHSSTPWLTSLARHWPSPLVGPSLCGSPLLAVNDVRGLVGTQVPQSRAVNLFSEETKS